jgi:hypothetical protein
MGERNEKKKKSRRLTLETAHSKLDPEYSGSSEYEVPGLQFGSSHKDWESTVQKVSHYPLSIAVSHGRFEKKRENVPCRKYHTGPSI